VVGYDCDYWFTGLVFFEDDAERVIIEYYYLVFSRMNKNISLGKHFDQFVKISVAEGRYQNNSEVVRAGLRLLEEQESKIIALKKIIKDNGTG